MNATSDLLLPYSLEIIYGGATLCPDKRIYMSHCRLQLHVTCKVMSITADPVSPQCSVPSVPVSTCSHAPDQRRNSGTCPCTCYLQWAPPPPPPPPATTFRPLNSQEAGVRPPAASSRLQSGENRESHVWSVECSSHVMMWGRHHAPLGRNLGRE